MYLMIENKGIAPITAFTRLGDSGSRNREGRFIGQFGTGAKHAINIFLRKGIECKICTDGTTLEFYFEVEHVQDADGEIRESFPVKCRTKGKSNRTIDCGWDLNFGGIDWKETGMGLREIVSNAIDWGKACGEDPTVTVADKVRNRKGYTRIFVNYSDQDVKLFHRDLGKTFLFFSGDPSRIDQLFLPKSPDSIGPTIYREGVKIRTIESKIPSVFDYNFQKGQIGIDECRNSSEYALRARIAQSINTADKDTLATLFKAMSEKQIYEASLDEFYLNYSSSAKENWQEAWEEASGGAVIATESLGDRSLAQHAIKKGHKVKRIKSDSFVQVAKKMGIKDVVGVLGTEGSGNVEVPVTQAAQEAVSKVWGWVETAGLTNGKMIPEVKSFKNIMDGESEVFGFYRHGEDSVHIREDLAGKIALKTAIEEVAHFITGATDSSRDLQNYAFDMIVEICS